MLFVTYFVATQFAVKKLVLNWFPDHVNHSCTNWQGGDIVRRKAWGYKGEIVAIVS